MTTQHVEYQVNGGDPGGTPTAMALASAGKSVLLVKKGPGLGGTCLFKGGIPSKIFRESARGLREPREASEFGLRLPTQDVTVNWSGVLERKRSILKRHGEAALQHTHQLPALESHFGPCRLLSRHAAIIHQQDGTKLQINFDKAILATGSVPFLPAIRGIDHPREHDSESILNIDHIPKRLVIVGGGQVPIRLPSRYDPPEARLASTAIAVLMHYA
jgi:dihydrolipoamide dehydrogenase